MGDAATSIDYALQSPEFLHGVDQEFWRLVHRTDQTLYIELWACDGHSYVLQLDCDGYGELPCRGRFVDRDTRACVTEAWPQGNEILSGWLKWDAGNFFVCWPADRGGVEHHPEWRARTHWRKSNNQLVQYLEC